MRINTLQRFPKEYEKYEDKLKELGRRLTFARAITACSISEFALKTGFSVATISSYEKGKHAPDAVFLIKVLELTNISPNYLFSTDGVSPNSTLDDYHRIIRGGKL